ncbi:D-amino acid dehydrogenase [Ferrovibrio sp.]|uniref:D-amino acid dehydrogenase n=1 Tax=Ferrovibrio sp. TaxID=1917215 RepID=UPI0025C48B67|nr:D-amino acid dehydrogenase [Ferrovibrio sp.]
MECVMHVVVIGAGVIGMSTAWALARDGHRVTVLEAGPEPATGTSHANGAQLSYSYVAPLANPGIWADLPKLLFGPGAAVRFRPGLDLQQYRWGLQFLRACNTDMARSTIQALLRLAFLSRDILTNAGDIAGLDFDHVQAGKLVVYSDAASLQAAAGLAQYQNTLGCQQQVLDRDGCLAREPALRHMGHRITGGIYTPDDAAGDPYKLCLGLAGLLGGHNGGVDFRFNTRVISLLRAGNRIGGVETEAGIVQGDAYVLAGGLDSRALALPIGIDLPIYPIKGYSFTLDVADEAEAPRVSITDYANKIVYARLGNRLRIAGMADIVGADHSLDSSRVQQLERQAGEAFKLPPGPRRAWCGLRPATPTGRPVLGASGLENLWLNVGHGALGFTLAFGSAAVIAALLGQREAPVPLADFALHAA